MAADEQNTPPAHPAVPIAPLPDHRNVNTSWWQELWRRHAHITTPLRARGLTCDIEFGLSAYIVRVPLPDNSHLIIGPPQEPVSDRPPGDPEGWIATREHPIDQSVFEVVYDSSPSDDPDAPQRPEARHGGSAEPLIAAIDHRLAQLGLLPSPELHTFEVTQDATVSFTPQARDLAAAHERIADLESMEVADTALDGGTRLTHITYGSVHDTDITAGRNATTTVPTACGDALWISPTRSTAARPTSRPPLCCAGSWTRRTGCWHDWPIPSKLRRTRRRKRNRMTGSTCPTTSPTPPPRYAASERTCRPPRPGCGH
ncbi:MULTISPECIES: hypothetical protein [Streptomyces]|uniref:Uncharacterized protein n=1 Tax=Streptomyces cavourensis TaxID=67258 RepID=A0ABY5FAA9_9ACTN|nr:MULTISPECIES: hypothetical protein [Streptomyces]UTR80667.1 hypothetical protein NLU04_20390 [Streptomyces cavourensis]WST13446.1 hypothetical protein OG721_05440 [Streptomyces microflavus]SCK26706.1 hypothetical protein YUYDRAFT_02944 [Streptomyces sp. ScaeMP-e48]